MAQRIKLYYELSTKLSYLSNHDLVLILSKGEKTQGWAVNTVFELDGSKIFCKQLDMTDIEKNNQFDTSNLFNLPTYYNYGIGSAGFNCFRELLMHIKTTNWVLDGQIENFPLMYHYRIIETPLDESKYNENFINEMTNKWNNKQVGEYLKARAYRQYSIMMFFEYIPLNLEEWLDDDYQKNKLYLEQILKIIRFLRKHSNRWTNNLFDRFWISL